ncbi:hypothetical protein CKAN_01981400 [Cinnamomum micranthum f. kanehirae]|uniref:Uncharacterized protein n=1 Tax=Cinnamomum micranthum f. kanehirae TaxID=337451 RepID=A0A443PIW5_9MAGN|nr:hypothetical protein CKAN_01981400 [Cinnamomum micranthum f. kanehirae]
MTGYISKVEMRGYILEAIAAKERFSSHHTSHSFLASLIIRKTLNSSLHCTLQKSLSFCSKPSPQQSKRFLGFSHTLIRILGAFERSCGMNDSGSKGSTSTAGGLTFILQSMALTLLFVRLVVLHTMICKFVIMTISLKVSIWMIYVGLTFEKSEDLLSPMLNVIQDNFK